MKQVIGYISTILGFLLVALSRVPKIFSKLTFLPNIVLNYLIYVGIGLIALGIILFILNRDTLESKSQITEEVPIYRGKEIVGYRRKK